MPEKNGEKTGSMSYKSAPERLMNQNCAQSLHQKGQRQPMK
jgi:hypothetical protein